MACCCGCFGENKKLLFGRADELSIEDSRECGALDGVDVGGRKNDGGKRRFHIGTTPLDSCDAELATPLKSSSRHLSGFDEI